MTNYRNQTKSKGLKAFCVILALLLIGAGAACGWGWYKVSKLEKQVAELKQERDESEDKIPMSFTTYGIVEEDYEKYGIPARATSSKLIVADFEPVGTTDKRCKWTIDWKDGSTSEPVEEYVSFNPEENNGASCAVGCLQAFNKPIAVTCTSVANSKITSTTSLEYVTRYCDFFSGSDYEMQHFTDSIDVFQDFVLDDSINPEYGSVEPDAFEADVKLVLTEQLYQYLRSIGSDVGDSITYLNLKTAIPSTTDKSFYESNGLSYNGWLNEFNALSGQDVAKYCVDNNTNHIGRIEATIRCYYKDELIYEFTTGTDWKISNACIAEMSVPPQSVTTTPEVAF